MIAFQDLKDILKKTLSWERKLKDFYEVAQVALSRDESKKVVGLLMGKLQEKLDILERIDLDSFGQTAWIRYAPDFKDEDLIPVGKIQRGSSPEEIFEHLLDYEMKLKSIYSHIAGNLVTRNQKELFESLALFKEEQIEEIDGLMKSQI